MTYLSKTPAFYRENQDSLTVTTGADFFKIGQSSPPCFSSAGATHAPFGVSYICAKLNGDADTTHPRASLSISPSISPSNARVGCSLVFDRVETAQSCTAGLLPTKGQLSIVAQNVDSGDIILTSNSLFIHIICR